MVNVRNMLCTISNSACIRYVNLCVLGKSRKHRKWMTVLQNIISIANLKYPLYELLICIIDRLIHKSNPLIQSVVSFAVMQCSSTYTIATVSIIQIFAMIDF